MRLQGTLCRVRVRTILVVSITFFLLLAAPNRGFSQQPGVASSQDTSAAQPSRAESGTKASAATVVVSVQPPLQSPIHIVPFREPGTVTPKLNFFPVGSHVTYFGGPVISNVHIVLVLYGPGAYLPNIAGTATPTMANFYNDITQSSLFDMLSEYNTVGVTAADGTAGTNQTIGHGFFDGQVTITPATANNGTIIIDNQIQAELLNQVNAGTLPAPVIDAQGNSNTLYMIFFPPGKTITDGTSSNSTTASFGTHRLFYGVMPDLQPPSGCSTGCGAGTTFDMATNVTSHELSEAVTDADVGPATTFARPLAWIDQVNGEIGDICVAQEAVVAANGTNYTVQQEFSNFQNDCVSAPPQLSVPAGNTVTPGQKFDLQVVVQNGNGSVLTKYTGTLHFTSSDANAVVPADYTFTAADAGLHTFVVSLGTVGAQTISVADTKTPFLTALNRPFTVVATTVNHLSVAQPGNVTQGTTFTSTVSARDVNNLLVSNYTGTVHFTSSDATAVLSPDAALTGGVGNFTVKLNALGSQGVGVSDTANGTILGSAGVTVLAVNPNPTVTTVINSANPSTFLQPATLTATVTQGGAPVTFGTIFFNVDGTLLGFNLLDATGHAQIASSTITGGPHVIYADFGGGDATHPSSSSAPLTLIVNPAPAAVALTSTSSPSFFGSLLGLSAQLSAPTAQPFGGTIIFFDGTTPIAVIPPSGGTANLSTPTLAVGTHSMTASYSGTANFTASVSAPLTQVISPAPIPDYSIVPDKTSATILAGQAATFTITTKSINAFNGNVAFSCGSLPAFTTCTFAPATAVISSGIPTVLVAVTIKTSGPHARLWSPGKRRPVYAMVWTALTPFALGMVLLAGGRRGRRKALLPIVLLLMLAGLTSCGGGGAATSNVVPSTTPAGTTAMSIKAAATTPAGGTAPANPAQALNISITVQP